MFNKRWGRVESRELRESDVIVIWFPAMRPKEHFKWQVCKLGKKWKNWFLTIFFKTNFLDVLFDVESESEIRFSKFLFVGEIWAKNDPNMQIRQKMKNLIFDDFL